MNTAKIHAASSKKLLNGPGGHRCPCCNPFGKHPRKSKKLASRHARRVSKTNLRGEEAGG